jgi:ribose transport system permease protein
MPVERESTVGHAYAAASGIGSNETGSGPGARASGGTAIRDKARRFVRPLRDHTALMLLILLLIIGGSLSDVFFTPQNLLNILWAVSVLGIVALGQTTLLITCNFDMSVACVVGLSGIVTVVAQIAGLGLVGSILAGLMSGFAIGFLNGLLVVATKANPFLITLGSNSLAYAIALTITHSRTLYTTIPAFNVLGRGRLFGVIHYSALLFVLLALILEFVLRRTTFGRSLFILGLNATAGRLSGLNMQRTRMIAFVLCGVTAALAGMIMTARIGSTVASAGFGMEFDSIVAAVLGGTSLFGGRGGALRTVIGVVVLGVINNLMILLDVPFESQQIAKGLVFLFVVWMDSLLRH